MTKTSQPKKKPVKTQRPLPERERGSGLVPAHDDFTSGVGAAAAAGHSPQPSGDDDTPGFKRLGEKPDDDNDEKLSRLRDKLTLEESRLLKDIDGAMDEGVMEERRKKIEDLEAEIADLADFENTEDDPNALGGRKTKSKRKTKRKTKKNRKTKSKRKTKRNTKKKTKKSHR
jgi:hypothetical protein